VVSEDVSHGRGDIGWIGVRGEPDPNSFGGVRRQLGVGHARNGAQGGSQICFLAIHRCLRRHLKKSTMSAGSGGVSADP
jgi:hypothetical protein